MYKKALGLSLLLATSSTLMADSFYNDESVVVGTHHEATAGGVGLIIGGLAGGPLGAIIGGSMGVMTGNNQTKNDTIEQQRVSISELENDLSIKISKLSKLTQSHQLSKQKIQILEVAEQQSQQTHRGELIEFANSYQYDIYFMTNSDVISAHAQQGLIKLAELLQSNDHVYANIEAHSDWRGSDDVNCLLARQRLTAVTDQLLQAGGQSDHMMATSYGEHANVNQGSWGEELFYDRRVTITLSYFE